MSAFDIIADQSQQNLTQVPDKILHMYNLKMLYLEGNTITILPDDFFLKLYQLTWLDLRNNELTKIPETIAHHLHLENLLLSNNKIESLPNEMGLVPALKVLHVGDNPLVYPSRKIIARGTSAICSYLREEYEKKEAEQEEHQEEVQKVIDYRTLPDEVRACIIKNSSAQKASYQGDDQKITHKISRDSSKVSLRSYLNTGSNASLKNARLKQGWMEKLRTLLTEQERILQQEKPLRQDKTEPHILFLKSLQTTGEMFRMDMKVNPSATNILFVSCWHLLLSIFVQNLRALNAWKIEIKSEPVRPVNEVAEPPYGTYPEYGRMLSREDLSKQIDELIYKSKPTPVDMDQIVNNLMSQVRKLESNYKEDNSPRTEMHTAGKQIKLIMELQKNLLQLQSNNF